MIAKRNGNVITYYDDNAEHVLLEVTVPEGGFSQADVEAFYEHLKREIAKRETGPS